MQQHDGRRRERLLPRLELLVQLRAAVDVVDQQQIDLAAIRRQQTSVGVDESRDIAIEVFAVVALLLPGRVDIAGRISSRHRRDALARDSGFPHRLTHGEKRLPIPRTSDNEPPRLQRRDRVVEQRKVGTRRSADIKFRLKTAQTGKLIEHRAILDLLNVCENRCATKGLRPVRFRNLIDLCQAHPTWQSADALHEQDHTSRCAPRRFRCVRGLHLRERLGVRIGSGDVAMSRASMDR
jgi:hypothetical protein